MTNNAYANGDQIKDIVKHISDNCPTSVDISGKENKFRYQAMPIAGADYVGKTFQYTGETDSNFTKNYFYQCVALDTDPVTYEWQEVDVQSGSNGQTIQLNELPTASAELVGKVYQYIGTTTQDLTHNYFYECKTQGTDPETYAWEAQPVQEGGGGAGHTIENSMGVDMTTRTNLQFVGASVTDDSTNDRTVVTVNTSDKADKVASATNGNLASLDNNGNLADSGVASSDVVTTSSTAGLLKNDGTVDTTSYVSDISGKADKATSATSGDLASLDSNGNIADSGIASNIFPSSATSSNKLATLADIGSGGITSQNITSMNVEINSGSGWTIDRVYVTYDDEGGE